MSLDLGLQREALVPEWPTNWGAARECSSWWTAPPGSCLRLPDTQGCAPGARTSCLTASPSQSFQLLPPITSLVTASPSSSLAFPPGGSVEGSEGQRVSGTTAGDPACHRAPQGTQISVAACLSHKPGGNRGRPQL